MVAKEFAVDMNKALVFQVGHLEEAYQEWVHQPIISKEGPRFFENDLLEKLTRTVWWAIPTTWLPVVCWCLVTSYHMGQSLTQLALLVFCGVFTWTFIEYILHRFLFHIRTKSYWSNTAHYLLHGCHHKHPMDGLRLVFPPAAAAILCIPFWSLAKLLVRPAAAPGLFGGGLLGYVMYDCTHYYLHYGRPSRNPAKHLKLLYLLLFFGSLLSIFVRESGLDSQHSLANFSEEADILLEFLCQRYHMNHHFRIQTMGFGITSSLWDGLFRTLPPPLKACEKSS